MRRLSVFLLTIIAMVGVIPFAGRNTILVDAHVREVTLNGQAPSIGSSRQHNPCV